MNGSELESLDVPQFVLVLHGPSCAGKSTVAQYIVDRYKNIFIAKRDKIKWLISDYNAEKHSMVTRRMILSMVEVALGNGLSVIQDQEISAQLRGEYNELIDKYNIQFIEINIEANFETILNRFKERVEAAKQGAQISNTNPERLKKLYQKYEEEKKSELPTINTDENTPEEVAERVLDLLKN